MAPRKPPPESDDRDAGNGDDRPSLERFKSLTKGLVKVTREELAKAERRYENERLKKSSN
jgi:hypothetical protein